MSKTYCIRCKKHTKNKDLNVSHIANGKTIITAYS